MGIYLRNYNIKSDLQTFELSETHLSLNFIFLWYINMQNEDFFFFFEDFVF